MPLASLVPGQAPHHFSLAMVVAIVSTQYTSIGGCFIKYSPKGNFLGVFQIFYTKVCFTIYIYVMGTLGDFGRHTKVPIYPKSAILLQMAVVLASPIPGLKNAG